MKIISLYNYPKYECLITLHFSAPKDYDELLDLLQEHSEKDQLTIITRLRKCHHVSLAEGNKQKLEVKIVNYTQFLSKEVGTFQWK